MRNRYYGYGRCRSLSTHLVVACSGREQSYLIAYTPTDRKGKNMSHWDFRPITKWCNGWFRNSSKLKGK